MNKLSAIIVSIILAGNVYAADAIKVTSSDGKIEAEISIIGQGRLAYTLKRGNTVIIEASPMGIIIDKVDLGLGVELGKPEKDKIKEKYAWRGVKSEVINNCIEMTIPVTHSKSKTKWSLQARAYDDGFAFRYLVPGEGKRHVNGEATAFSLPAGTFMWFTRNTSSYEGNFEKHVVEKVDFEFAFPVTLELKDGTHAAITEANIMGYSGMVPKGTLSQKLNSVFNDDQNGWDMEGNIASPWRIVMTGPDLNALVNCDIVHNVCPAPDKKIFPKGVNTKWIKPGRSLWQWWAYRNPGTHWSKQKWFVDQAAALNLEYYLVDEGWEHPRQNWLDENKSPWPKMKELCDYAKSKGVGIWAWRSWHSSTKAKKLWIGLQTDEIRRDFFSKCAEVGIVGVKIDFMNSESHDLLDFYQACLREAAKHKIMVNFHGANKPAGEPRTWPNEMTREGIKGLEFNTFGKWRVWLQKDHYTKAPFIRYLGGHGDFTPISMQKEFKRGTTLGLQMASSVILTSPFLCFADKPDFYLESNILPFIKTLPPTWDETIVLPGSKIGELAAFARRNGDTWYVAVINNRQNGDYSIDLSFLDKGKYSAVYYEDTEDPQNVTIREAKVKKGNKLDVKIGQHGGFVGVFKK
ncbi:hypothetical protein BVX94_01270 [bacterium B17]|nr:hypothetical protein BVX94_01270 [bacterium B17]